MVSEAVYKEVLDENRMLNTKLAALTLELDNLKRVIFGSSSERHSGGTPDASLPSLFPTEAPVEQEAPVTEQITYERSKPRAPKNNTDRLDIADHIERRKLVLEPDGVDVSGMQCIGETVNRRLMYIPASFLMLETIRPKYKDPQTGRILQAPAIDQVFAKSCVDERRSLHCLN